MIHYTMSGRVIQIISTITWDVENGVLASIINRNMNIFDEHIFQGGTQEQVVKDFIKKF